MKLGIYVGSFNPPHEGHHQVINYLLDNKYVDKVLLLPTPGYWDKNNLVSIEDRINMLKYYEDNNVIVDSTHNNYPYTYQVLRSIKNDYDDELYLIIGSDNLEKLHEWKNIDEILENNKIIVLKREDYNKNIYLDKYEDRFIYVDDFKPIKVSSTEIREGNSNFINPNILKYIEEHNLY